MGVGFFEIDFPIYPLKIIKHVISMFIAINDLTFSKRYKELVDFVKDENVQNLNSNYKIYMYLNIKEMRYSQMSTVGSIVNSNVVLCSEIAFPPFGFVISLNSGIIDNSSLRDITFFKDYGFNEKKIVNIELASLDAYSYLILDYRTKDEIDKLKSI